MAQETLEFRLEDVVRLRKPHPCGGYDWRIERLGADLGMRCLKCQHRVMIDRFTVQKRLKTFVSRGPDVGFSWPPPGLDLPS